MATITGPTKRSGQQAIFILAIDWGGESSFLQNINREIVADTTESVPVPISIVPAQSEERKLSDVQGIEVDMTTTDEMDEEQEVCATVPPKRQAHKPKEDKKLQKQQTEDTLDNLSKLFDKSLLTELNSEDTWMDRLRLVIEQGDEQGFELMGPYTNPLWSQMAVQDDCILVNDRLAVPLQLRQAVLKRIHRGHLGQEAMLGVSQYLWWPHMHKDIVNLAEECRNCTRYGKNVKYLIQKNASKPLPLLPQPGQEVQLDYAGRLENHRGKNRPSSSYRSFLEISFGKSH